MTRSGVIVCWSPDGSDVGTPLLLLDDNYNDQLIVFPSQTDDLKDHFRKEVYDYNLAAEEAEEEVIIRNIVVSIVDREGYNFIMANGNNIEFPRGGWIEYNPSDADIFAGHVGFRRVKSW